MRESASWWFGSLISITPPSPFLQSTHAWCDDTMTRLRFYSPFLCLQEWVFHACVAQEFGENKYQQMIWHSDQLTAVRVILTYIEMAPDMMKRWRDWGLNLPLSFHALVSFLLVLWNCQVAVSASRWFGSLIRKPFPYHTSPYCCWLMWWHDDETEASTPLSLAILVSFSW